MNNSSSIDIQSGARPDGKAVGVIKAGGARVGSFIAPNDLQINVFGPGGNVIASLYDGSPEKTVRVTPYFDQEDVQMGALEEAVEHWGRRKTFVSSSQEGLELLGRIFQEHLSRRRAEAEEVRKDLQGETSSEEHQQPKQVPSAGKLGPEDDSAHWPRLGGMAARKETT
jgi:hypothetical protein